MKSEITINGETLKIKQTLRALFIFEQIRKRPFEIKETMDNNVYSYSNILANNPDTTLTWDAFIDALDNDPSIMVKFTAILAQNEERDAIFDSEETDPQGKKKD